MTFKEFYLAEQDRRQQRGWTTGQKLAAGAAGAAALGGLGVAAHKGMLPGNFGKGWWNRLGNTKVTDTVTKHTPQTPVDTVASRSNPAGGGGSPFPGARPPVVTRPPVRPRVKANPVRTSFGANKA